MRASQSLAQRIILVGLCAAVLFSTLAVALTPEAAQTKVAPYFGAADSANLVASPPLTYNDQTFYLFYFHTTLARRVLAVVNGDTGLLEADNSTLTTLGSAAYRLDVTTFRLDPQLSFGQLSGFLATSKSKVQSVSTTLPSAKSQISSYASTVDISDLETKLSDASDALGNAQASVDQGSSVQSELTRSGTVDSVNSFYNQFSTAFNDVNAFLDAAGAYDAALKDKAAEVNKDASLTVDQKRNINTALGSLALDPDGSLLTFRTRVFGPGRQDFNDLKAGESAWVSASIDGFAFLSAKTDAESTQNDLAPDIASFKANKRAYVQCNADPTALIKTYDDNVKVLAQASATSSTELYQSAQLQLSDLRAQVSTLKDAFLACQNGTPSATPTATPSNPNNPGNSFILPIIIFIAILAVLFTVLKRKPPEGTPEGDANAGV